jgi:maltooligosyltrehalose trehalohydrolase
LHPTSDSSQVHRRKYAVGAEPAGDGRMSVRVWAPDRRRVAVVVDGVATPLEPGEDGWFAGSVSGHAGSRYGFHLDDDPKIYPDPASRFQPDGPHGLSELVDPSRYAWKDEKWPGVSLKGQAFYELHVGTFSAEGTWAAAAEHLDRLAALGITAIQMMPVAEFAGTFGWGYDGVDWFAPTRLYGRPDDLRAFVDAAHARGLAVVLDVVYNHLGPDGNYLLSYARDYVTDRYPNEWGDALNFDGPNAGPVREMVLANVEHWVREYHVDGFRLDATQQMFDSSAEHILTALVRRARAAAGGRRVVVIAENEPQHAELMRPYDQRGSDVDALYNDDFHHTARVALTGLREAYYSGFGGTAQELLSAAKRGFLFQGQRFTWQDKSRGTPALDRPMRQFLHFLENHDQVANSAAGRRLCELSAPGQLRALTALLLLGPATPLLFQGQESGSTTPFLYFADHGGELGRSVREGRLGFLGQFRRFRTPSIAARQLDPTARSTFEMCKLRHDDTERSERFRALHHDLLRLRREDRTIALQGEAGLDGATLDARSFVLRLSGGGDGDRLLVVNLGTDIDLATRTEPLVAPPAGASWSIVWSSEDPAYGGSGTPAWEPESWPMPGHAALLLAPKPQVGRPTSPEGAR